MIIPPTVDNAIIHVSGSIFPAELEDAGGKRAVLIVGAMLDLIVGAMLGIRLETLLAVGEGIGSETG